MEDFNSLVTSEPSWKNASPEANFQSSAVGMLHRAWFPKVSWNIVKRTYKRDTGEEAVTWEWYVKNCIRQEDELGTSFNFSFSRNLGVWQLTIQDLLFTPLEKLEVYKEFKENDCTAIIFPVVGKAIMLIQSGDFSVEGDYLAKCSKDGVAYLLISLETFAKSSPVDTFYSSDCDFFD